MSREIKYPNSHSTDEHEVDSKNRKESLWKPICKQFGIGGRAKDGLLHHLSREYDLFLQELHNDDPQTSVIAAARQILVNHESIKWQADRHGYHEGYANMIIALQYIHMNAPTQQAKTIIPEFACFESEDLKKRLLRVARFWYGVSFRMDWGWSQERQEEFPRAPINPLVDVCLFTREGDGGILLTFGAEGNEAIPAVFVRDLADEALRRFLGFPEIFLPELVVIETPPYLPPGGVLGPAYWSRLRNLTSPKRK